MCISLMREHNKPGLAFLYFFHDFSHLNIYFLGSLLFVKGTSSNHSTKGWLRSFMLLQGSMFVPFVFGSLYHSLYGHQMKAHCGYSEKP